MKISRFLFLVLFLLSNWVFASDVTEQQFIEMAKATPVNELDPLLQSNSFDAWLKSVVMTSSEIIWEVNDCGEQTGDPADKGRDFPACVEAIFTMTPEVRVHVSLRVGTFKRGIVGRPRLYMVYLKRNGKYQYLNQLSELLALSEENKPRNSDALSNER